PAHAAGRVGEAAVEARRPPLHARRLDREAHRLRNRDVLRARGRADPRRHGLFEGAARRALYSRREDNRDLRGHERDPADGDRETGDRTEIGACGAWGLGLGPEIEEGVSDPSPSLSLTRSFISDPSPKPRAPGPFSQAQAPGP